MNVIFCTNIPSPYRVDFFNEFGKFVNLTVLYERKTSSERNSSWKGNKALNFKEVYLDLTPVGVDRARGTALKDYIKCNPSDALFFQEIVSPATMEAIIWCRLHGRPYFIEYDGGYNKKDSFIKRLVKKILLNGALGHLTTAEEHISYLRDFGIPDNKIFKYPFTSIGESDIEQAQSYTCKGKDIYKKKLGITEEKMLLSVGRFSYENGYGKGYDILMKVAKKLDKSVGVYIVGDEPTDEFIEWKEKEALTNVHFVGFKTKIELADYYAASDMFILLSRGDVWGLVINEAMAFGLPIISSDKCIAGLELVKNGTNGFVVSLDNVELIKEKIEFILGSDSRIIEYARNSLGIIKNYTFECMSQRHMDIINQ